MRPRLSENACDVAIETLAWPSSYVWFWIVPLAVGLTLLTVIATVRDAVIAPPLPVLPLSFVEKFSVSEPE